MSRIALFTRSLLLIVLMSTAALGGRLAPYAVRAQDQKQTDPIATYKQAGINSKQEEKIRDLASKYEQSTEERARMMFGYFRALKSLSYAPDLDDKLILETQASINKIQNEMNLDKMRLLIDIRKVLTHEQRVKLVNIIQSRDSAPSTLPAQ